MSDHVLTYNQNQITGNIWGKQTFLKTKDPLNQ